MIRPGLVSITFRKLSVDEIIAACVKAELAGIEWGGDVHAPHGDVAIAKEVGRKTREAGLSVAAYGSYYRVGFETPDQFERVLDSAVALHSPIIRVWMGKVGSAQADERIWNDVISDANRVSELAFKAGVTLAAEWHGNTLMDNPAACHRILKSVDHPAFQTYWQPHQRLPHDAALADIDNALHRLVGVHIFEWDVQTVEKLPLAQGRNHWLGYLAKLSTAGDLYGLLEFVKGERLEQFYEDAKTLKDWLSEINPKEEEEDQSE